MANLLLFGPARDAAGAAQFQIPGSTVGQVLDEACAKFGEEFGAILDKSATWLNGDSTHRDVPVTDSDEVAVLPPVSGG